MNQKKINNTLNTNETINAPSDEMIKSKYKWNKDYLNNTNNNSNRMIDTSPNISIMKNKRLPKKFKIYTTNFKKPNDNNIEYFSQQPNKKKENSSN